MMKRRIDFVQCDENGVLRSRRGSALLIVLGFLAFMIVSAVTYSIYMRAERLPSSALRRTVQTRHLVHGALAQAISRVDDAIRDDPFPGLLTNSKYLSEGSESGEMDHWTGRVFTPPSLTAEGDQLYAAPIAKTVSTLTLEGLGYLPPPVVNDARFLSRSSWAGQWVTLPFDSGRAAYCAVNVTDMLDVTRIWANKPRTALEGSRISLAYLLDQDFHPWESEDSGSVDGFGSNAQKFDELVHDGDGSKRESGNSQNSIGSEAPFVSMLDYSLGIHQGISGVMESLFYQWIRNGQKDQPIYEQEGDRSEWARRQPFVTESCATNQVYTADIATTDGQPFKDNMISGDSVSMMQIAQKTKFLENLMLSAGPRNFANGTEAGSLLIAELFDYLDHNHVPISLAMPCVERVPMLAALAPMGFKIKPTKAESKGEDKSGDTTTTKWTINLMQWFNAGKFRVVVAFPFKHNMSKRSKDNDEYEVELIARLALVPSSCSSLRLGDLHEALRPDWEEEEEGSVCKLKGQDGVFCVSFRSTQTVNVPTSIVDDEQAGTQLELNIDPPDDLGTVRDFLEEVKTEGSEGKAGVTTYKAHILPLGTDGKPFPSGKNPGDELSSEEYSQLVSTSFQPMLFVWARIVDGDDKTVDLVPAVLEDDKELNDINSQTPALASYLGTRKDGPVLRFQVGATFNWQNLTQGNGGVDGTDKEWSPTALATLDPRFNWAPEDWYGCEDETAKEFSTWLKSVNEYLKANAHSNRDLDSDIFTFTSDQGFLQSLGEFAFLPRVTDDNGSAAMATIGEGGFNGQLRTTKESIANKNCAWCSYRVDREFYEAMEAHGIGRSTKYECLVNPYTPDTTIMMAALANSPVDYWAAAECAPSEDERKGRELKAKYGNKKNSTEVKDASAALNEYCFCSKNADAKMSYKELVKFAKAMTSKFRGNVDDAMADKGYEDNLANPVAADAWKAMFDDYGHGDSDRESYQLQWWARADDETSFNKLFDVDLEQPLYGIDRKFLYSYWRDCFANNQQLFLIFVRAESNALGGAGEGTPGQKGGRAVAMVWRNPCPTDAQGRSADANKTYQENRKPHQTRVLFYHQFD